MSPLIPLSNVLVDRYSVAFYAYTPTANSYTSNTFVSDPMAEFTITGARLDVNDPQFTSASVPNAEIQSARFATPFTSPFTSGDLNAGQLIE